MEIKNREQYIKEVIIPMSKESMVSNYTIQNLSNNIDFLKSLKNNLESGSGSIYDRYLFESLSKKSLSKKLTLQN